jgi:hypothetical protein
MQFILKIGYVNILGVKMLKENSEIFLMTLKGFYEVVNTKQKVCLFMLTWAMFGGSLLAHRIVTVDTIERLIVVPRYQYLREKGQMPLPTLVPQSKV